MRMSIGADPEVFVRENGHFFSPHGFLYGTKDNPYYVNNGMEAVQVDGVAAEFNVRTTALDGTRRTEFIGNVGRVFKTLDSIVKKYHPKAELVAQPVAEFDPVYFDSLPKEQKELGCTPDFCSWTGYPNRRPDGSVAYRTGSGHVHLGWTRPDRKKHDIADDDFFQECMNISCELDYYLGLPSLLWDTDDRRRTLYGKAGAFRPKFYGFEYRVLSNVWVDKPDLIGYIYDACRLCLENYFAGKKFVDIYGDLARHAIDDKADWSVVDLTQLGHKLPEGF